MRVQVGRERLGSSLRRPLFAGNQQRVIPDQCRGSPTPVHNLGFSRSPRPIPCPGWFPARRCGAGPPGRECHVARGGNAVHEDAVGELLGHLTQQDHRRQGDAHLDGALIQHHRVEDQAVDEVGPGPGHQFVFALGVGASFLDLDNPALFVGHLHDVLRNLCGVGRGQVRQRQGDDTRPPVAQATGGEVGHVVEFEMACSTLSRVDPLTGTIPFITFETVLGETPARRATSLTVARTAPLSDPRRLLSRQWRTLQMTC
jgi:hypothetical protein